MFHRLTSFNQIRSLDTIRLLGLIAFFGQLYFFVPVMTPYLLQRQLSIAEIAGLQTTLMIAMLAMEIPTGIVADRLGHVWSYRIALIVLASGEFGLLFARDYWAFLLIQVITGTGFAFGSGSVDAILYDALPEGDRLSAMQRAKGFLGAATQTGSVVAYSIGGIIAADLTLSRMTINIILGAIAVATGAALSFRLHEASHVAERARPDSRKLLATAWRSIRSNPTLLKIVALSVATHAFGAHLLVFYQQYFLETAVPGVWFGLGLSIASLGVVIAQFYAWKLPKRIGTPRAMLLSTLFPGILYLGMAWNGLAWLAVLLFVVQWAVIHLSGPLFSGLFNIHLPDEARATSLSLINGATTVYIGLGGIFLGRLADRSLPLTFALMGVIIVVAALAIRLNDRSTTALTA